MQGGGFLYMNRRGFLQTSIGTVAAYAFSASVQNIAEGDPLSKVNIYSRHLQWLRSADEVADAANYMGYYYCVINLMPEF